MAGGMASGTERALVCFARLVKADDTAAAAAWLDGGGQIDAQFKRPKTSRYADGSQWLRPHAGG